MKEVMRKNWESMEEANFGKKNLEKEQQDTGTLLNKWENEEERLQGQANVDVKRTHP